MEPTKKMIDNNNNFELRGSKISNSWVNDHLFLNLLSYAGDDQI